MKIISKFHDYYDIGLGLGQDDNDRIYKRTTVGSFSKPRDKIGYVRSDKYLVVGFCGKTYPLIKLMFDGKNGFQCFNNIPHKTYYCYNIESVKNACDINGISYGHKKSYWSNIIFDDMADFFDSNLADFKSIFNEYNCPLFCAEFNDSYTHKWSLAKSKIGEVIINPYLKEFEFYKIFDSYTAYQEIDMYLSIEDPPIDTVSDEHRYSGHGYDKYSFRSTKGVKKPRRKNKGENHERD